MLLCIQVLQVGVDIHTSDMLVTCLKMKHACQTIFPLGHMPFKDIYPLFSFYRTKVAINFPVTSSQHT